MIRIAQLTKTFGAMQALAGIDLNVGRGESLGLTGPNGSGRTTLLRIVATLVRPSSGSIEIDGVDAVRHAYRLRPRIAYLGAEAFEAERMRVRDYFRLALSARGRAATNEIVDAAAARAGLDPAVTCTALSGGGHQRLALAAALASQPDVVLLDDPFRALDQAGRSRFVEWLLEARERGAALLVATQSDEDISAICCRVARFDQGRLIGVSAVSRSAPQARTAALR